MSLDESFAPAEPARVRGEGGSPSARPPETRSWAPKEAARDPGAPTHTFRLPNGKTMRVSTDRVRAKPAVAPQVSFMLGQNALGLGLWGLLAPKGVNRFLGINASPQTTQALFGAREMATGVVLFRDPTVSNALWARVAGDIFDIVVLKRLTHPGNPKRGNARFALGVVLAVTAMDLFAAWRMTGVKRNCEESAR